MRAAHKKGLLHTLDELKAAMRECTGQHADAFVTNGVCLSAAATQRERARKCAGRQSLRLTPSATELLRTKLLRTVWLHPLRQREGQAGWGGNARGECAVVKCALAGRAAPDRFFALPNQLNSMLQILCRNPVDRLHVRQGGSHHKATRAVADRSTAAPQADISNLFAFFCLFQQNLMIFWRELKSHFCCFTIGAAHVRPHACTGHRPGGIIRRCTKRPVTQWHWRLRAIMVCIPGCEGDEENNVAGSHAPPIAQRILCGTDPGRRLIVEQRVTTAEIRAQAKRWPTCCAGFGRAKQRGQPTS